MKVSSKKIEESAVTVLEMSFNQVDNVLTHFSKNDKGICIDGNIEVYSSPSMSKETFRGEIPVQIKGTCSKPSSWDEPKKRVSVGDLKRYLDVYQGVLYFVVFLDEHLNLRGIYYKEYLPYDLVRVLARCEGQDTFTERFRPLPPDASSLKRICLEFVGNRKRQGGNKGVAFASLDDWEKHGLEFVRFELEKTYFANETPFSCGVMANGAYVYGVTQWGEPYVVDKIEDFSAFEIVGTPCVSAGSVSCDMEVKFHKGNGYESLEFGGFTIRAGNSPAMFYKSKGDFCQRLRDSAIAREVALSGSVYVDGQTICSGARFNSLTLDEIETQIRICKRYVELLDRLYIKVSIDPDELSENELEQLGMLGAAFIDGAHLHLSNATDSLACVNVDIAGARVKVIAKRDDQGRYELYNPIESTMCCVFGYQNSEGSSDISPVPPIFIFDKEDFQLAANIDSAKFEESLDKLPITISVAEEACLKLLEMLSAFDDGAVCKTELILCCKILADRLAEIENSSENSLINQAQVLARMNALDDETRGKLEDIAIETSNVLARASAYILLGDTSLADKCLERMTEEERSIFSSWPVSHLREGMI